MILIDKEKLIADVVERRYSQASMKLIREQPEIEAIPIEWIQDYLDTRFLPIGQIDSISKMVSEWVKEYGQ